MLRTKPDQAELDKFIQDYLQDKDRGARPAEPAAAPRCPSKAEVLATDGRTARWARWDLGHCGGKPCRVDCADDMVLCCPQTPRTTQDLANTPNTRTRRTPGALLRQVGRAAAAGAGGGGLGVSWGVDEYHSRPFLALSKAN